MENVCAKCHQIGNGCCYIRGTSSSLQIGIFNDDIIKIARYLNISRDVFVIKDNVNDALREFLSNTIHPVFNKIFYKNTRYKLKSKDEKCVFLTDFGCKLPTTVRPLYCRVYPFWPSYNNQHISVLSSDDCLAQNESTLNWQIVNKHFGYTEEYLRERFKEILMSAERHINAF